MSGAGDRARTNRASGDARCVQALPARPALRAPRGAIDGRKDWSSLAAPSLLLACGAMNLRAALHALPCSLLSLLGLVLACKPAERLDGGQDSGRDATVDASAEASADATFDVDEGAVNGRDITRLLRTCALSIACDDTPPAAPLSACVGALRAFADPAFSMLNPAYEAIVRRYLACADRAIACEAFWQCATMGHGADWCRDHPGDACDGTLLVRCAVRGTPTWANVVEDCALIGQRCANEGAGAVCTTGRTCADNADRCEGTRLVRCRVDRLETFGDCANWPGGGICLPDTGDGGALSARCGPGPAGRRACSESGAWCDGDRLTSCVERGFPVLETDCAAQQARCVPDLVGARCVPLASECQPEEADRCEGDALATCLDGRWRSVPCETVFKSRCALVGARARCVD